MKESTQTWLTTAQVCELLGVQKRTLQTWRDKGLISYSQIGAKQWYKESDIYEMLEKSRIK